MKKKSQIPETIEEIIGDPVIRREWIRFQLRIHGSSFSLLAKEIGVSRQAVADVFRHSYPRMERAIAEKLKMKPQTLWPERYLDEKNNT